MQGGCVPPLALPAPVAWLAQSFILSGSTTIDRPKHKGTTPQGALPQRYLFYESCRLALPSVFISWCPACTYRSNQTLVALRPVKLDSCVQVVHSTLAPTCGDLQETEVFVQKSSCTHCSDT
eukprot:scaffold73419_cov15-Tisochrysis_lutea.AAC.1